MLDFLPFILISITLIICSNILGRVSGKIESLKFFEKVVEDICDRRRKDLDAYTLLFVLDTFQRHLLESTEAGKRIKKERLEKQKKGWKKIPNESCNKK